MGMIFELTGSLAQKLDRIKLGRFRKWLERDTEGLDNPPETAGPQSKLSAK